MDPLTLIVVALALLLLVGVIAGRVDAFAACAAVVILVVILYAVPRLR